MKKLISVSIIGMIFFFAMTGCPYESPVPLSDPGKSMIDPVLPGIWVNSKSNPDGTNDTLLIIKFNDHEYYLESHEIKNGKFIVSRGRGFTTMVNNHRIINISALEEPGKFYFARYEVTGNMMILTYLSDNFIKKRFSSRRDFYEFCKENLDKEGFYETGDTYQRVK
jgi:hypothetical protein